RAQIVATAAQRSEEVLTWRQLQVVAGRAVPGRLLGDDARVAGERGTRWSRPCLDADRTGDLECSAAGNADVARAVEVSGIPDDARTRGTAEIAAVVSQPGGIGQIVHVPYGDVAVGPDA